MHASPCMLARRGARTVDVLVEEVGHARDRYAADLQATTSSSAPRASQSRPIDLADDGLSDAVEVLLDDNFNYLPEAHKPTVVPGSAGVQQGHRRYRMEVQYDGRHFMGWDRDVRRDANVTWDGDAGSVRCARHALEAALGVALDVSDVAVVSAVRCETGVHARRLTCHLDVPADVAVDPRAVLSRAHVWLRERADPLAVLSFERADDEFHAFHSSLSRTYLYRIQNRIAPPLFEVGHLWHVDRALDVDAMAEAAVDLQGTRDFGAFADHRVARAIRKEGDAYTVRTVDAVRVVQQDDEVHLWFTGKSFLRHQILHMVGALKFIGQGIWDREQLRLMMESGFSASVRFDDSRPPRAPVHGLTLWDVVYR